MKKGKGIPILFQGTVLKFHTLLLLTSDWSELSPMTTLAAREAGRHYPYLKSRLCFTETWDFYLPVEE